MPSKFRKRIVDSYAEIKRRHREAVSGASLDAAGLSAGKFCESVIRLLQHALTGDSTAFGKHIPNFPDACRQLITLDASTGPESLRILIPRALVFLNTMRGKRGIGHVGGDVEANSIDLATIVRICDWVMCELIRIYHDLPIENAQAIVDSLAAKEVPLVWEVGGKKRVLRPGLNFKQKVLLLLYSQADSAALAEEVFEWSEHPQMAHFRRDVLKPLHATKLIEYDRAEEIVYLSPLGISEVEKVLTDRANTP
ncbi:MAG: hypothetical protein ABI609_15890 [Acidobacteriota bacterium]